MRTRVRPARRRHISTVVRVYDQYLSQPLLVWPLVDFTASLLCHQSAGTVHFLVDAYNLNLNLKCRQPNQVTKKSESGPAALPNTFLYSSVTGSMQQSVKPPGRWNTILLYFIFIFFSEQQDRFDGRSVSAEELALQITVMTL